MQSFATWLRERADSNDPALGGLKKFAAGNGEWPYWSDKRHEYEDVINRSSLPNNDKSELATALAEYFGEWKAEQKLAEQPKKKRWLEENFGLLALVLFGLIIGICFYYGLFGAAGFYQSLASIEQARGLITFLFVLSTSGLILLIGIAIFWMDLDQNIKERFAYAKDLLTMVIGILGTIMGFYFGLQVSEGTMGITNITVSKPIATSKDNVVLGGQIVGGKGPYKGTVEFTDPTGAVPEVAKMKKDFKSDTGPFSETIAMPEVKKAGAILFSVKATDVKSVQAQSIPGVLFVEPTNQTSPSPANPSPPNPGNAKPAD